MKTELEYGHWEIHPQIPKLLLPKEPLSSPEMKAMTTLHEGVVTYFKFWNFWVRIGTPAIVPTDDFFHNYESSSNLVKALISAVEPPNLLAAH